MIIVLKDFLIIFHLDYFRDVQPKMPEYEDNFLLCWRGYFCWLINKRKRNKRKKTGKMSWGVLYLHDNAQAHKNCTIHNVGYKKIERPPYSPDRVPSEYYLFPKLKQHLQKKNFSDDEHIIVAVNEWLTGQQMFLKPSKPFVPDSPNI